MEESDRMLLETMLRNYWTPDNNKTCVKMSIISLRQFGFDDRRIKDILECDIIDDKSLVKCEEQLEEELRVFCLEYEYTHSNDDKVSVKVMHSLGKDPDEAQSNLSRSNFDNGKYDLIKSYPIDILYCGDAFAITPIEQIR